MDVQRKIISLNQISLISEPKNVRICAADCSWAVRSGTMNCGGSMDGGVYCSYIKFQPDRSSGLGAGTRSVRSVLIVVRVVATFS